MTFEGSVFGAVGTMEIYSFGRLAAGETEWNGKWVIVSGSGTEELSTVSGKGTWWDSGWQGDPRAYGQEWCAGEVKFDILKQPRQNESKESRR